MLFRRRSKPEVVEPEVVQPAPYPSFDASVLYSNGDGALALGIDPQIGYRGANPLEALDDDQFTRWWDDRRRQATVLREEGVDWAEGIEAAENDPHDTLGAVQAKADFEVRQEKRERARQKAARKEAKKARKKAKAASA